MNKRNIFLLFGIIIFTVFSTAACNSTPQQQTAPQTIITITDIPAEYNGRVGLVRFNVNQAWATGSISEGSLVLPVLDWSRDLPYSLYGNYRVFLGIGIDFSHVGEEKFLYSGILISKNIAHEAASISWSEFILEFSGN